MNNIRRRVRHVCRTCTHSDILHISQAPLIVQQGSVDATFGAWSIDGEYTLHLMRIIAIYGGDYHITDAHNNLSNVGVWGIYE